MLRIHPRRLNQCIIETVQQLSLPDGRTAYRGLYTKNAQQYQITVAQDGSIVSEGLVTGAGQ